MRRTIASCLLASSCCLFACSGSDEGPSAPAADSGSSGGDTALDEDTGSAPDDTGALPADSGAATFTQVYALFNGRCGTCHKGGSPDGNLSLSTKATAYAELVSVKAEGSACRTGGKTRVVPGDPEASLLVEKLKPGPSCGLRMPQGGKQFTADELATVTSWIAAGANDD